MCIAQDHLPNKWQKLTLKSGLSDSKVFTLKREGHQGDEPIPGDISDELDTALFSIWGTKLHKESPLERRARARSLFEPVLGSMRAARRLGQRHWLFRAFAKAWFKALFVHCSDFYRVLHLHPQGPWAASPTYRGLQSLSPSAREQPAPIMARVPERVGGSGTRGRTAQEVGWAGGTVSGRIRVEALHAHCSPNKQALLLLRQRIKDLLAAYFYIT